MPQGPFKAKRMRITVNPNDPAYDPAGYVLGVVEGMDIELNKEGGIVPHYDAEVGRHAIGTRHATLRLRRWFKADDSMTDLLFDMFNGETLFDLQGEITSVVGSTVALSGCLAYSYRPVTGGANDIVSEEVRCECIDWETGTIHD